MPLVIFLVCQVVLWLFLPLFKDRVQNVTDEKLHVISVVRQPVRHDNAFIIHLCITPTENVIHLPNLLIENVTFPPFPPAKLVPEMSWQSEVVMQFVFWHLPMKMSSSTHCLVLKNRMSRGKWSLLPSGAPSKYFNDLLGEGQKQSNWYLVEGHADGIES